MAEQVEETQGNLLDFNWEAEGEDFFNIQEETVVQTPPKKEEKKEEVETEEEEDDKSKTTPTKTETTKTDEIDDFFGTEETETSEEDDKGSKGLQQEVTTSDNFYSDVYKDLKENGLFKHVEVEEGEELDQDKLFEIQQEEYEAEVSARLKAWATEDLDEDAKAFIKFKRDGGNTSEFFKTYSTSTDLPSGNIADEDYQDSVIRYQLRDEGWDSDEIEDRLQYLTESGKKEKIAKRYDAKVKEKESQNKQAVLIQAQKQKEAAKQQKETFKSTIKTVLSDTKEINGVKFSEKDKTQLYNFLTKEQHKISDSKSITSFQKKLGEAFQDTNKMILLAKLVSSDFDLSQFEKATVTKTTKKIKSNLEQRKNLRPSNSGSSMQGDSLADLFN